MRDLYYLGATPADENCAQVGIEDYAHWARIETTAYSAQLRRMLQANGMGEANVRVRSKAEFHDYGTYYEVVVSFDNEDEKAADAAWWLENNTPANWDEEAKQFLLEQGYTLNK